MTSDHSYVAWVKQFDIIGARERIVFRRNLRALPRHPLISIVMPVYNPDLVHLSSAIDSVRAQIYGNWELCIADDASTDESVARTLEQYATADSRIKVTFRERNGHIAACSNSALELATGEWVALLDQDDLSRPSMPLPWSPQRLRNTHKPASSTLTKIKLTNRARYLPVL